MRKIQRLFLTTGVYLSLTCFCQAESMSEPITVKVDANTQYQTIQAFGASDAWLIDPLISHWMQQGQEQHIQQLGELLFSKEKGIGLTAWRFNIGAGSQQQGKNSQIKLDGLKKDFRRAGLMQKLPYGEIDLNAQAGQVRMLQEAAHYQVPDLIAFVNSPPVWATRNGRAFPDKHNHLSNLQPEMLPAFSDFLINVIKQLNNKHQIKINYLSPINEPTWDWKNGNQEGTPYSIAEMKAVYRSVYQTLVEHNLQEQVRIEGGEVVEYSAALSDNAYQQFTGKNKNYNAGMNKHADGDYRNYLEHFLGDKEMRTILGNKLSLHGYFADAWQDRLGPLRDAVWQDAQRISPGAELWMSEMCILGGTGDIRHFKGKQFDPQDMEYAIHIARLLHRDLTRLNVSAWHWWLAITAYNYKDGLLKVNPQLDADSLEPSKVFWTLGQYSRFIRPGYRRIKSTGADNLKGLMVSAYQSPDSTQQVMVITNASEQQQQLTIKRKLTLNKQTQLIEKAYVTNAQSNLELIKLINNGDELTIPSKSIITLISQFK